jgi:hypothetical protein
VKYEPEIVENLNKLTQSVDCNVDAIRWLQQRLWIVNSMLKLVEFTRHAFGDVKITLTYDCDFTGCGGEIINPVMEICVDDDEFYDKFLHIQEEVGNCLFNYIDWGPCRHCGA